ncbi:hypothetical protein [Nonomuraea diastatica]|uniref:Uncharacterized protein n=1 Tax=Nonomuraea diastatica TaxID=1848329 RepID=A0A4R4WG81_9ACTN|nr:hypothetical protein [Nonomuraea diastatica]TDD18009.1 hypothetical protein E1294_25665 [Nonomuraea diastatica]
MDRGEWHGSTRDHAVLGLLRDVEPSAGGSVDIGRAMRAGRRRVRRRRVAVAVAAAAATALAVFLPSLPWTRPAPPATPASQLVQDGQAFDAAAPAFLVGSAGGFTPDSYETGRYRQVIRLRSTDPASRATAVITMYAPGRQPSLPDGEPAPPVNDRPARWIPRGLAWEWAPGAWGTVALEDQTEDRDRAHRVAQSVLPRRGAPVSIPFTVDPAAIGAGRRLIGVVTSYPNDQVTTRVSVKYGTHDLAGDWIEVGVRQPRPSTAPNADLSSTPAAISASEVLLLPAGKPYAIFARGGDGPARRTLATAVTVNAGSLNT